ncbi:uncharacterized protein LOC135498969 isoform X2 [Lineus longissimus]|uniref:uncharacterized protein LOC135498969 isoform X2 n=1 Tax=Lineus longissimus TaxID=88925 RepID=UPI00315D17B4
MPGQNKRQSTRSSLFTESEDVAYEKVLKKAKEVNVKEKQDHRQSQARQVIAKEQTPSTRTSFESTETYPYSPLACSPSPGRSSVAYPYSPLKCSPSSGRSSVASSTQSSISHAISTPTKTTPPPLGRGKVALSPQGSDSNATSDDAWQDAIFSGLYHLTQHNVEVGSAGVRRGVRLAKTNLAKVTFHHNKEIDSLKQALAEVKGQVVKYQQMENHTHVKLMAANKSISTLQT